LAPDRKGFFGSEEIYWKQYYTIQRPGGTDLTQPSILHSDQHSSTIQCGGNVTIRIEAGNPLILLDSRLKQEEDFRITPVEGDEWNIIAAKGILRDARFNHTTAIGDDITQQWILAPHIKSSNGMGVFVGLDAEGDSVISSITDETYDYIDLKECNKAIVGFFEWPLWQYMREGGDADYFNNGAIRYKDADTFFNVGRIDAATENLEYNFPTNKFGSYMVLIKNEIGYFDLKIGTDADFDSCLEESVSSETEFTAQVNYAEGDISDERSIFRIGITYSSSVNHIDYVVVLPLSNGFHFPLDFIQQLLARNG